jgi:hypothetical protein
MNRYRWIPDLPFTLTPQGRTFILDRNKDKIFLSRDGLINVERADTKTITG